MSGTRFTRSGRCRFFIILCAIVLMFGMIAIFHSSQQQLDATRTSFAICEQQQEALNQRLQSMVEDKFNLEKNNEFERNEHMQTQKLLEHRIKDLHTKQDEDILKLQRRLTHTQSEHSQAINECTKSKKLNLEDIKKLQSERSQLQKENNGHHTELTLWKEKYEAMVREKDRLEVLLTATETKDHSQKRIRNLERAVAEYQSHCDYKLNQNQLNNLFGPPDTTRTSPQAHNFNKPRNDISFKDQVLVSPGLYHIGVNLTNKIQENVTATDLKYPATNNLKPAFQQAANAGGDSSGGGVVGDGAKVGDIAPTAESVNLKNMQQLLPFSARNNRSLIINSVENFQILPKPIKKLSEETETQLKQQPIDDAPVAAAVGSKLVLPLSAPHKSASTEATKSAHLKPAGNSSISTSSSSTNLPPLPVPPNQRKLPENVAPIPANFDELLKNDQTNQKAASNKLENGGNGADVDAAVEEMQRNDNDDRNNNRYVNAVQGMEHKGIKAPANEDSGAHEIKDHDFVNDQNFNLPAEEDSNFFEGGKNGAVGAAEKHKNEDNENDEMGGGGAGDIAVKNHNHLLDADNLNNEVAGDQGKEFPDGLRLEDGNEEDEDEDDYSNLAARQQGAQAIRI